MSNEAHEHVHLAVNLGGLWTADRYNRVPSCVLKWVVFQRDYESRICLGFVCVCVCIRACVQIYVRAVSAHKYSIYPSLQLVQQYTSVGGMYNNYG